VVAHLDEASERLARGRRHPRRLARAWPRRVSEWFVFGFLPLVIVGVILVMGFHRGMVKLPSKSDGAAPESSFGISSLPRAALAGVVLEVEDANGVGLACGVPQLPHQIAPSLPLSRPT
jgi:hypothetical protein